MADESRLLPNVDRAIIPVEKLRDYLLSLEHKDGRSKAVVFLSLGFTQNEWQDLARALREQHLNKEAVLSGENEYGLKYAVTEPLVGPTGERLVRSVWIVEFGEDFPRLLTAYPVRTT